MNAKFYLLLCVFLCYREFHVVNAASFAKAKSSGLFFKQGASNPVFSFSGVSGSGGQRGGKSESNAEVESAGRSGNFRFFHPGFGLFGDGMWGIPMLKLDLHGLLIGLGLEKLLNVLWLKNIWDHGWLLDDLGEKAGVGETGVGTKLGIGSGMNLGPKVVNDLVINAVTHVCAGVVLGIVGHIGISLNAALKVKLYMLVLDHVNAALRASIITSVGGSIKAQLITHVAARVTAHVMLSALVALGVEARLRAFAWWLVLIQVGLQLKAHPLLSAIVV